MQVYFERSSRDLLLSSKVSCRDVLVLSRRNREETGLTNTFVNMANMMERPEVVSAGFPRDGSKCSLRDWTCARDMSALRGG